MVLNIGIFLLLVGFCSGFMPVLAPMQKRDVSRLYPSSWHIPVRQTMKDRNSRQLIARQRPKLKARQSQVPIQVCPEALGGTPKPCSQCGGDSKQSGICDNILVSGPQQNCPPAGPYDQCSGYFCKCTSGGSIDSSPKVTITTVIGEATATAVWEPLTVSPYSRLQASTTITIAATPSPSGS